MANDSSNNDIQVNMDLWTPEKAQEILDYSASQGFENRIETAKNKNGGLPFSHI